MSFQQITGHKRAITIIQKAIQHAKIAHAYLFHGPAAIGKKFCAIQFAKVLNCRQQQLDSCDICESCLKIEHQNHMDVQILEADGNTIKIQQIRNLQEELALKSFQARFRVFIIDNAELMNEAAANCLLKTLEEPPSQNVIILITSALHRLLPTVLSRCAKIPFAPLTHQELETFLSQTRQLPGDQATLLARFAEGSIGKALSLDPTVIFTARRAFLDRIRRLSLNHMAELFELAKEIAADDTHFPDQMAFMKLWLRDLLLLHQPDLREAIVNQDMISELLRLKPQFSEASLIRIFRLLCDFESSLKVNANKQLGLENILIEIAHTEVKTHLPGAGEPKTAPANRRG
jgi:DNA polymerase-3 subunit delta'